MIPANWFLIILAVLFAFIILNKTKNQKILEKESIRWIFISLAVILLGFFPNLIIEVAHLVGFEYAPSLLFLLSILVLFYFILRQSIQISELNNQIRELAQKTALLDQALEEVNNHEETNNLEEVNNLIN